jgi:hypothetical protein
MSSTPWEYDGVGGLNNKYHHDPTSNQVTIQYSQPVNAIIRNNQLRRKTENNSARRRSGELFQIAEIPVGIIHMWKVKHGVDIHNRDHWQGVKQLIASREYNAAVGVTDGEYLTAPVKQHFIGQRNSASHPLGSNRAGTGRGPLVKSGVF